MFLILLVTAATLLFLYLKWNFAYWTRQGFPYFKSQIPFGVLDKVVRREASLGMAIYDVYRQSSEKVVGIHLLLRPALLVRDAELVRDMLTKDFNSFHDRGIYVDEEHDPLSGNLFSLRGKRWKTLRTKLTPSFTSGKLKAMFDTVEDVSVKMLNHLNSVVPNEGFAELEMKKVMTTYAIDIIASVIFGLEVNSFKDTNNSFLTVKKELNIPTYGSVIRGTAQFLYPTLEKIFVAVGWKELAPHKMREIVSETIAYRDKNNVTRRDMLQLLLQLRNTGNINEDDSVWTAEKTSDSIHGMTIDFISAQLFLFFSAGFETSASAAAFTIYELSQYPDILAKAQADVQQALQKHDGKLTYDSVQDMKYLDLCIMETVRKYPGLPILNRECTQDFPLPDSDLVIKEGTPIIISLFGMHRDNNYFPDAMRYQPERFLEENMNYNPLAYIPFGEGPRHCIAQRMGKLNVKVALAQILTNFNIEVRKERKEIDIDTFGVPIMPKGGINVRLSKKTSVTVTH